MNSTRHNARVSHCQVRGLRTATATVGYLTVSPGAWKVTTWTGEHMMDVTRVRKARQGFPDETGRRPERWHVQAVDAHGTRWVGSGPGPQMYVRLRRAAAGGDL